MSFMGEPRGAQDEAIYVREVSAKRHRDQQAAKALRALNPKP